MKLLAIGIDGLSFRVTAPWIREGQLPHLGSLMVAGSHGILRSTMPPLTPPSWFSSLTGVNPGRHNVFGFFKGCRTGYAKIPVSFADVRAPFVWDYLQRAEKDSVVLYLPVSYPPPPVRGVMVSGFMTPDGATDWAQPPAVMDELAVAVPGFRLNLDHAAIRLGRLEEFFAGALKVLEDQTQAAIHLMRKRPWDFFFIHLHDIDSVTHIFWKFQDPEHPGYRPENPHRDKLRDYYRAVDGAVGRLLEAAGREKPAVMVYSDHGFMAARRAFKVNRWLADRGLLNLKGRGALGAKNALLSLGLGRERLKRLAGKVGLGGVISHLPRAVKQAVPQTRFSFDTLARHVDWEATDCFFLSASEGSLYANVKGREPRGKLGREAADRMLRALRDELLLERDPVGGHPLLGGAWLGNELFHGEWAADAPDMILLPAEGYYFSEQASGPLVDDQGIENHQISATHHPDGVLITSGVPFLRGAASVGPVTVWDVAPTILRVLGVDPPRDLDGRVLDELIDPSWLARTGQGFAEALVPAAIGEGLAAGEREQIMDNLKGLGYL